MQVQRHDIDHDAFCCLVASGNRAIGSKSEAIRVCAARGERLLLCQALWFVGELGDSCDDLCEFEGYAGCDAEEMGEIKTRPRISRLLAGLNTTGQYSCSSYNPIANSPAYNPSGETCYPLSGQVRKL